MTESPVVVLLKLVLTLATLLMVNSTAVISGSIGMQSLTSATPTLSSKAATVSS